jgi:hypothetical protein
VFVLSVKGGVGSLRSEDEYEYEEEDEVAMAGVLFDHERLEVYRVQLRVIGWLADLFEELQTVKRGRLTEALEQLDRASLSVLLNIAEGNGRRGSQQRVKFFDDARGSATECDEIDGGCGGEDRGGEGRGNVDFEEEGGSMRRGTRRHRGRGRVRGGGRING